MMRTFTSCIHAVNWLHRYFNLSGINFVTSLVVATLIEAASYEIPLHHPFYSYMDMLPISANVDNLNLASRPYTEEQACSILIRVDRQHEDVDTAVNHFYLRQFGHKMDDSPPEYKPVTLNINHGSCKVYPYITTSFSLQDSNFSASGFDAVSVDTLSDANEFLSSTGTGVRLFCNIGKLLIHFDGTIWTRYSSLSQWIKRNDPKLGANYTSILSKRNTPSNLMGYDNFTAYIKFPFSLFDIKIGNDRVGWGYGATSGMLLSGMAEPFFHLKVNKSMGELHYCFLLGKLIGDTYHENRVIYAKNIAYTPYSWLSLAFLDAVITSGRALEPLYLMPFIPFYFTEHYLGDLDNRFMSFNSMLIFYSKVSLYAELFLDDISNLLGIFTNKDWGDKWGACAGFKIYNILPLVKTSVLKAEIVQTEPWLYTTSAKPDQKNKNYPVHFGKPLGYSLGPHCLTLSFDFQCQLNKIFRSQIGIRQFLKGSGPGSSIFDTNPYVTDTVDGNIRVYELYPTKEYRFEQTKRNRTVFSAAVYATPRHWLTIGFNSDLAHECNPKKMNLFRSAISTNFNY